ncbi:MAG: non-canonical purine NTP pyrophosphatase [Clostridiales bacterium]|nr:non-canonical purine NTP pyrophosphatase [Clostridiales bacterium]
MKLIIASNNKGKISEYKRILEPLGYEVVSQRDAGINLEVEENGKTFEENSALKARAIYAFAKSANSFCNANDTQSANISNFATLADDSGLEVNALNNAPGIYSARYGGEGLNDTERCNHLLENLKSIPKNERGARFVCTIHFIKEDGQEISVRGECEGLIGFEKLGENGFGYDPVFMYGDKSFAQIGADIKNKVSHRAEALRKLMSEL